MPNLANDPRVKITRLSLVSGAANQLTFSYAPVNKAVTAYPATTVVDFTYNGVTWFYGQVSSVTYNIKKGEIEHVCKSREDIISEDPWSPVNRKYNGELDTILPQGFVPNANLALILATEQSAFAPFFTVNNNLPAGADGAEVLTEGRSAFQFLQECLKRVPYARWVPEYPLNGGTPIIQIYPVPGGRNVHVLNKDNIVDGTFTEDASETGRILEVVAKGQYHPVIRDLEILPYEPLDNGCCDKYWEFVAGAHLKPSPQGAGPATWKIQMQAYRFGCVKFYMETVDDGFGNLTEVKRARVTMFIIRHGSEQGAGGSVDRVGFDNENLLSIGPATGSTGSATTLVNSAERSLWDSADPSSAIWGEPYDFNLALAEIQGWQECERCRRQLESTYKFKPQRNISENFGSFDILWSDTGRIGIVQVPEDFPFSDPNHSLYPFYYIRGDSTSPIARLWTPPKAPDNSNWLQFCLEDAGNLGEWKNFGQLEFMENSIGIKGYGDVDLASIALKDAEKAGSAPPAPPNWPTTHVQYAYVLKYAESRNGIRYLDRHRVFDHDSLIAFGNPADQANSAIVGGTHSTIINLADGYELLYAEPYWTGSVTVKLDCVGTEFECPYKVGDRITLPAELCLGDMQNVQAVIQELDLTKVQFGTVRMTLGRKSGRQNPFERPDTLKSYVEDPRGPFTDIYGHERV